MERTEFAASYSRVVNGSHVMSEAEIRERIHGHADSDKDIPVCIGELSELILELTRHQRGKMEYADFLQELSHVQWAVWSLQDSFGIFDDELRAAVQAARTCRISSARGAARGYPKIVPILRHNDSVYLSNYTHER